MADLQSTATGTGPKCCIPATPLVMRAWCQALEDHPDKEFVAYILAGLCQGFHIGADMIHPSRHGNLPSVQQHPTLVVEHLAAERAAGRLLGRLPPQLVNSCQTSPIGLIPKPHQPDKWRLIVDLSSPRGASVNEAIASEPCHMRYASVLDSAALVRQLGQGTVLTDTYQSIQTITHSWASSRGRTPLLTWHSHSDCDQPPKYFQHLQMRWHG